jgi:tetratricopeptide (TPR) repeat protein
MKLKTDKPRQKQRDGRGNGICQKYVAKIMRLDFYTSFLASIYTPLQAVLLANKKHLSYNNYKMKSFFYFLEKRRFLIFFIFLFVALALYCQSLPCDFILDDISFITNNPLIKNLKFLPRIWVEDTYRFSASKTSGYYRPFLLTTFAVDYAVWGLKPFGFRITNILLHSINSYLVFIFLLALSKNFSLSFIASTLFCIHPIHTSAVSYISGRADLLATLFILLSLLYFKRYLENQKLNTYITSIFLFLLALTSRENALLMPLLALLLVLKNRRLSQNIFLAVSGFWFIALFYLLNHPILIFNASAMIPIQKLWLYFCIESLNTAHILKNYMFLILFPRTLFLMRTTPPVFSLTISDGIFIGAFFYFFYLAVKDFQKKRSIFSFGFFWAIICLLPLPKLIHYFPNLGMTMAEHWLYLPSIGLFGIAGYLLHPLLNKHKIIFISLILFYGTLSIINNGTWKNETSILSQILKNNPKNPVAVMRLGNIYYEKGLYNKALGIFNTLLVKNPYSWQAYNQIGNIYRELGQFDKALEAYNKSIEINPKDEIPYVNIGLIYEAQNKYKEAMEIFIRGLKIEPDSWLIFFNIGTWCLSRGLYPDSIAAFQRSLSLNPDCSNTNIGLAMAFFKLGLKTQAQQSLQQALRLQPHSIINLKNIGAVFGNNGEPEKAVQIWEMALRLKPANNEIKSYIARAKKSMQIIEGEATK